MAASDPNLCQRMNDGVDELVAGRRREAIVLFRECLMMMSNRVQTGPETPSTFMPPPLVERTIPLSVAAAVTAEPDMEEPTSFGIYRKAFQVHRDEDDDYILSYVLLYNTAVAYHTWGYSNGTARELSSALRLYHQLYTSLQQELSDNLRHKALLLMATCNNLGHVYSLLSDHARADFLFHQLRALTARIQADGIAPTDLEFFLVTISLGNSQMQVRLASSPSA